MTSAAGLPFVAVFGSTGLDERGCTCTSCVAERRQADVAKDKSLAAVVYQVGVEVLRSAALDRVPLFQEMFS